MNKTSVPKLTAKELKQYLNAKIRDRARWDTGKTIEDDISVGLNFSFMDDSVLRKVARKVHDSIVSSFDYDSRILDATRSVKNFGVPYIMNVLKGALNGGMFEKSSPKVHSIVKEKVDEVCKTVGKKIRSKGKGRGLGRGKGKGPLGIPIKKKSK